MQQVEFWLGSMLWAAVALLMPMSALAPVQARGPSVETVSIAADACPDGSARLAMGCESIHL